MHTDRCRFAKTGPEKCKCSCKGILHGGKDEHERMNTDGDLLLTESMGGEIAKFIQEVKGKEYYCPGPHKHKENIHTIDTFYGYEHPGGLTDKDGKKWWVYVICPIKRKKGSQHQTSFTHLPVEIRRADLEREYISWEVE